MRTIVNNDNNNFNTIFFFCFVLFFLFQEANVPESNHSTDNAFPELTDFVPICKQAYPNLLNGDPMLPQVIIFT